MVRILFAGAGMVFFLIGSIGKVMPFLPTTPFYLLALFCFSKSSPKFKHWLTGTKLYRKYIKSFDEDRSLKLKTKIIILAFASISLITASFIAAIPAVRALIISVLAVKYWYFIFIVKTID